MTLHVERQGQGRPLVLLHGWGLHGGVFAAMAGRLANRFDVWSVDLPGHGRSAPLSQPTLKAVAAEVAAAVPAGAAWLGWSLGGMTALAAASAARAGELVLVCASPRFVADTDWPGTPAEVLERFAEELETDHRGTLARFVALQARGSERAREEVRQLRAALFAYGEPDRAALRGGLEALLTADLRPHLADITAPTLLVGGRRDTLVPFAALERTAAIMPSARAVAVEGAGHAPFLSHPDAFDALLMDFLNE